jgi:hypothetical protein
MESGGNRVLGFLKGIAAGVVAAFSVRAVVTFGKEAVAAAMDAEKAFEGLRFQVNKSGTDFEKVRKEVEALGEFGLSKTIFGDEAIYESLTKLTAMTGDYRRAVELLPVAVDLAAGANVTLEQATMALGKGVNGITGALTRMGVEVDKTGDVAAQVMAKFGGAMAAQVETFGGKWAIVTQRLGEVREEIGKAMLEAGGGTSVLVRRISCFSPGKARPPSRPRPARARARAIRAMIPATFASAPLLALETALNGVALNGTAAAHGLAPELEGERWNGAGGGTQ